MNTETKIIQVYDTERDRTWEIPRRPIKRVLAEVSERWVANVIVPEEVCRELVRLPWLEPIPSRAGYVLSVCAIFMKHAATDWAPLQTGPSSRNCALRVACRDTRTGEEVVWVDHRYSDSFLVSVLAKLGFPPVYPNLQVELGRDFYGHRQLILGSADHMLNLRLIEYPEQERAESKAFEDTEAFETYFTAGVRSYGPTARRDRATVVDLKKCSDNHFEAMPRYFGILKTPMGSWPVESVYRTRDGLYEWTYEGEVTA